MSGLNNTKAYYNSYLKRKNTKSVIIEHPKTSQKFETKIVKIIWTKKFKNSKTSTCF